MAELQQITGVGPSRADSLAEAGYETVEAVSEADPEALAADAELREDTALEIIVNAQNLLDEEEADEPAADESAEEDFQTVSEQVADAVDEEEPEPEPEPEPAPEPEPEPEPDPEPESIVFDVSFDQPLEYDTFFECLLNQRGNMYKSNRNNVEAYNHAIEQMRAGSDETGVELSLSARQLNDLHNTVRGRAVEYKGDNLIDEMNALERIRTRINEVRDEHLF